MRQISQSLLHLCFCHNPLIQDSEMQGITWIFSSERLVSCPICLLARLGIHFAHSVFARDKGKRNNGLCCPQGIKCSEMCGLVTFSSDFCFAVGNFPRSFQRKKLLEVGPFGHSPSNSFLLSNEYFRMKIRPICPWLGRNLWMNAVSGDGGCASRTATTKVWNPVFIYPAEILYSGKEQNCQILFWKLGRFFLSFVFLGGGVGWSRVVISSLLEFCNKDAIFIGQE